MAKIYGVRSMEVSMSAGEASTIRLELMADPGYDARPLYERTDWDELMPGKVIIPCQHCGQYGAIKTSCRFCGAPISP